MCRIVPRVPMLIFVVCIAIGAIAAAEEAPPGREEIVISLAGDCTLGTTNRFQGYQGSFVTLMGEKGFDYPFSGVIDIFGADDLTLVNLEGTFTDSKKAMDKAFVFRAPPRYAEILPLGSVEAVNIANNHIHDFLARGKADTIAALEQNGVLHSGNGVYAIFETKGVRIGMTGYSYPHTRTLGYLESRDIPELRALGCDIIILSMHAGTEEQYKINRTQTSVARGAIDLGVDIVVGHHPHVLQAVEVYKGKPIFYSLGNFSFGGNSNPKDWDTLIGQVVVERVGSGVRLTEMRLIPCLISGAEGRSDFRPVVAEGERKEAIFQKLLKYSPDIDPGIFEAGSLSLSGLSRTYFRSRDAIYPQVPGTPERMAE